MALPNMLPDTGTVGIWLRAILPFIWRHLGYGWGFVQALPQPIPLLPYLAIVTACGGVVLSHVFAILKYRQFWVKRDNCNLMYGYFMGSGAHQARLLYKHAHWQIREGKWIYGISGVAYYLGNLNCDSRLVKFLLSFAYIPLVILGVFELAVRVAVGTVYLVVMMLVHRLLLLAFKLLSYGFIILGNMIDRNMRRGQYCTHCYIPYDLPVFICRECKAEHKDLTPGLWGVLAARCKCNKAFLPTMVLTGRSRLKSICPSEHCKKELAAANAQQLFVHLIGGAKSGKTSYLAALQDSYIAYASSRSVFISGAPEEAARKLNGIYIGYDEPPGGTTHGNSGQAAAHTLLHQYRSIKNAPRDALVVFDHFGQSLEEGDFVQNPLHYGFCHGFILFIDPECIPSMYEQTEDRELKGRARSFGVALNQFVLMLNEITGTTGERHTMPVAIVISKADMLLAPPKASGSPHAGSTNKFKEYLISHGLSNEVKKIDAAFSNVAFFLVNSQIGTASNMNAQVLAPMRWILKQANSNLSNLVKK